MFIFNPKIKRILMVTKRHEILFIDANVVGEFYVN
jgi:hypothetical protein